MIRSHRGSPVERSWPGLARGTTALAAQVAGGPVVTIALPSEPLGADTVLLQVSCTDLPQRPSPAEYTAAVPQMLADGPLFGPHMAVTLPVCDGFAVAPDPVVADPPPGALPPVLLLGALHDPSTPYVWSEHLPGSVLVTYEGAQHGNWNTRSPCIQALGDRYVIDLELPEPGVRCPMVGFSDEGG